MSTTTTNMGLIVPAANDTDYPASIVTTMGLLDAHDHTSGKGLQIPTGGIADLAVTTAKINDLAVTTAKLAAGSVTQAKRVALGQQVSGSSGSYSSNANTPTDVTNLSVTITTTGRPIFLSLIPDGTTNPARIGLTNVTPVAAAVALIYLIEGATEIARFEVFTQSSNTDILDHMTPPGSVTFIRPVAAGTYTYKIQAATGGTGYFFAAYNCKLIAYEL